MHRTTVYLLIVDKELDEWEENTKLGRIRKWFDLIEAKVELEKHKPVQGSYLNLLKGIERPFISLTSLASIGLPFHTNLQLNSSSQSSSSSNSSSFNISPVSSSTNSKSSALI